MTTNNTADTPRSRTVDRLVDEGAVAVVRLPDADRLARVALALREGGLNALEITLTTPNAFGIIAQLAGELGDEALIGAGSVLDADNAQRAIDAGASYVVSPVFRPDVVRATHEAGAAAIPGAFTPTEALAATNAGADIVKVFPADVVGIPFFKAVLAPMPALRLMPTGGVTPSNAGDWIRAGAVAVGVGSALLDKAAIANDDMHTLTRNARTLKQSIADARS